MAHPRLVQAKDELLSAIEASAPGSLILVIGPTGVGKSTLRRRVESALIEKMAAEMEIDTGRIPFISIEAVAPDNGIFHWRDHYQRMLAQIQEPAIEHKLGLERGEGERTGNGRYAPWPRGFTGYQLQQSIENALQHRRPAAVFIDEAQHLGRIASGRKLADQLDVIKSTASRSNTVHVLIGTYELLAFRNLSAQLSRRSVDLHFSRYRTESAEDSRGLSECSVHISEAASILRAAGFSQRLGLPLRALVGLHRHLKRLAHAGVGRSCPKRYSCVEFGRLGKDGAIRVPVRKDAARCTRGGSTPGR